ncbi:alpha/beta fold hydrolase [Psychrobacillus sp. FSL K6-2365]|uniref:alpha/beta fold hydrolase n=1 Tax=Psychrobacillus sp. FSL K6-2365 TaxID=2921546 RepID=UPI0030F77A89
MKRLAEGAVNQHSLKRRDFLKDIELEYKVVGSGKSILILETGIGGSFYNWYPFIQEIQEDFTIVMYHRAGYGNSPVSKELRTTKNIAEELYELIDRIGITEKFVLIGHSFGGLCVQQFSKMYSHKIKGVILIDSTSYNFNKLYNLDIPVMNSLISIDKMVENNMENSNKSKEELNIKFKNMIVEYENTLPYSEAKDYEELITNPLFFKTIAKEFENWGISSENILELGDFPNIPLIVITRDKAVSVKAFVEHDIPVEEAILYEDTWRELQIELSHSSKKGELVIAEGSDHDIHIDRPDIIIQCLKRFL